MDPLDQIVEAVLYEGYVLWPYRRSAIKNQQRWTFGGVYPAAYSRTTGGTDRDLVRTDCLIEAGLGDSVEISIRFLHVVARQAARLLGDRLEPVDELTIGGRRLLSWDEATERRTKVQASVGELAGRKFLRIDVPAGSETEWLSDDGRREAALVRTWEAVSAEVRLSATDEGGCVHRISVTVHNDSSWPGTQRAEAVRRTLVSTHVVLRSQEGRFLSSTDTPEDLRTAIESCSNRGLWPVLVGEQGERHTILASPIIMADYPRVAPESPGDLFDGGEIDQLLVLNILSLTDEEKREMADSDPRAREILERTSALTATDLSRLHGTIREFRPLES
jgi:hypothetical protein